MKKKRKKSKKLKRKRKILRLAKESKSKKTVEMPKPLKSSLEKEPIHKTKIMVVGIGGGGSSIVAEIALRLKSLPNLQKKISFVVANTDVQALKKLKRYIKIFPFGETLTHGLGTGMNAEIGKLAAQQEKEKIKKLLEGYDFCIFVASLGGGVGSGSTPIFTKVARNLDLITLGIFTLPFKFEGGKKLEIARNSLLKLKPSLNAICILPNERIFQVISKNTSLKEALSAINKNLAEGLEGLIETIYLPGLINIDFADLKTIMEGRGRLAYLNTYQTFQKEGAVKEIIEKVLNSPLFAYGIRGAKGVLFNIAGEKKLSLEEVNQISKTISEKINKEAKIIFGISQGKKYAEIIKTTLLATGCGTKIFLERSKRKILKKKIPKPTLLPPTEEKKPKVFKKKRKKKARIFKKNKIFVPEETQEKKPQIPKPAGEKIEVKVRKNALQIKKEAEEAEKEFLEKEKIWETPAFLRKLQNK
jgi:cell division protein FtsZ